MTKERRIFHKRQFLNDREGAAMIEASLYNRSWEDKEGKRQFSLDGEVHITDCSRSVSLSIDVNDSKSWANAVHKLERVIRVLEQMKDRINAEASHELDKK